MINTKDFENKMSNYMKLFNKELDRGLIASADALLKDSTSIAPFDRGFAGGLVSTANKTEPRNGEIMVGYNKEYAVRLHEDMSLKIKRGRTQKFLENPMKNNGSKYGNIINDFISKI